MAIALISEIDLLGRQSIALFAGDDGPSHAELKQAINRVNVQGEVEKLFAISLPRLWHDSDGVKADPNFKSRLADQIDGERRAVLDDVDLGLERFTA